MDGTIMDHRPEETEVFIQHDRVNSQREMIWASMDRYGRDDEEEGDEEDEDDDDDEDKLLYLLWSFQLPCLRSWQEQDYSTYSMMENPWNRKNMQTKPRKTQLGWNQ